MKKLNTLVAAVSLGITASFAVLPAASAHSAFGGAPSSSHPLHLHPHPSYTHVSHVKKPSLHNLTKVCEQVKEIKDFGPVKIDDDFKVVGLVLIHPGCGAAVAYPKSYGDDTAKSYNDGTDQSYSDDTDQSYSDDTDQSYSDGADQSYSDDTAPSYSDDTAPSYSDYADGDEGYQARSIRRISISK